MRSIWFALIDTSVAAVDSELRHHGFMCLERHAEFRYPSTNSPTLYLKCSGYEWVEEYGLQDEYAELLHATGGLIPTVHVSADISGRVPGDEEVRRLAEILLRRFKGFAFDDFLSYAHAWTLPEIERDTIVNGLKFFDYRGHWQLTQEAERRRGM